MGISHTFLLLFLWIWIVIIQKCNEFLLSLLTISCHWSLFTPPENIKISCRPESFNFIKKTLQNVFSCEICEIFKNNYFEKYWKRLLLLFLEWFYSICNINSYQLVVLFFILLYVLVDVSNNSNYSIITYFHHISPFSTLLCCYFVLTAILFKTFIVKLHTGQGIQEGTK